MKLFLSSVLTFAVAATFWGCNDILPSAPSAIDQPTDPELAVVVDSSRQFFRNYQRERVVSEGSAKTTAGNYSNFTDGTGTISIGIWKSAGYGNHPIVQTTIDPDYVLVGGGANVDYGGGPGAMLTATYPVLSSTNPVTSTLSTWEARSKDHLSVNPHWLYVYAVGMKLQGVSRQTVYNNMAVWIQNSTTTNHPSVTANVAAGYTCIGGGAFAHYTGAGQLLDGSYPSTTSYGWCASSRDHITADPGYVTAYAVGIHENIPGFGSLRRNTPYVIGATSSGLQRITLNPTSGSVPTCPGAWAVVSTSGGWGRMLTELRLYGPQFAASSKDHLKVSSGYIWLRGVEIYKYQ